MAYSECGDRLFEAGLRAAGEEPVKFAGVDGKN
jgi:hypothetical protein